MTKYITLKLTEGEAAAVSFVLSAAMEDEGGAFLRKLTRARDKIREQGVYTGFDVVAMEAEKRKT